MHTFEIFTQQIKYTQLEKQKLFVLDNYFNYFKKMQASYPTIFDELSKEKDLFVIKDVFDGRIVDENISKHSDLELKGYLETWKYVLDNYKKLTLNTPTIILLHSLMYRYTGNPNGGKIRKQEIYIHCREKGKEHEFDYAHMPAPYKLVKSYLESLFKAFNEGMEKNSNIKLVLICMFIFNFLRIHPFVDGNGRTSRILLIILLLQNNIMLPKYVPLEKYRTGKYLSAIYKAENGWNDNKDNPHYYIYAFLNYLLDLCVELDSRICKKLNIDINSNRHIFNYCSSFKYIPVLKSPILELNLLNNKFNSCKNNIDLIKYLNSYNDAFNIKDVYFDVDKIKNIDLVVNDSTVSHHNIEEIDNYRKVKQYVIDNYNNLDINIDTIIKIHSMIINKNIGFRETESVVMKKNKEESRTIVSKNIDAVFIREAMNNLVTEYHKAINANQNIFYVLSELTLDFVHIHPFVDGNGRTLRMLELLILLKNNVNFVLYAPMDAYNKKILYAKLKYSVLNWAQGINNPIYYKVEYLTYLLDNAKIVEERINKYKNSN